MTAYSHLASVGATREVIERFGLGLKRSLGQNFLVNDAVIGKILSLAEVSAGDLILEVGPGIGTLSAAMLGSGAEVVAIERDPRLYDVLPETLAGFSGFHLIEKDALDVGSGDIERALGGDPGAEIGAEGAFEMPHKMVANLPYSVAATIILDYFQRFGFLDSATVMVQREVAERICAKPCSKSYGAYTVKLSMHACAMGSFSVAPGSFMPPPHVDSTVIRLVRRDLLTADGFAADERLIRAACDMADSAFYLRRKTVGNSMRSYFSGRPEVQSAIPDILQTAGIDGRRRGETLDLIEFLRLGECYLACIS